MASFSKCQHSRRMKIIQFLSPLATFGAMACIRRPVDRCVNSIDCLSFILYLLFSKDYSNRVPLSVFTSSLMDKRQIQNIQPRSNSYRAARSRFRSHERPPCKICGFNRYIELCHITAAANSGTNDNNNLIYLCPNHHRLFDTHKLNKQELSKLDDIQLLAYNAGVTQTKTFHYIHPRSDLGRGRPSSK